MVKKNNPEERAKKEKSSVPPIEPKKSPKQTEKPKQPTPKQIKQFPTIKLKTERDIAMDFAEKAYTKFNKLIKSVILFGSAVKHTNTTGSDIDIILLVDDVSIKFDDKLVLWYREELGKLIQKNPYKKDLHINTVKLTTWWHDLTRGDPTVINILRYGESIIDFGGFFNPLKILLQQGKIKPSPESIYTVLNRIPGHILRSRIAELSAIEGCYWAFVESAQALLMSVKVLPPSPEHIPILLKENFVDKKLMKMKCVTDFRDLYDLHKKIIHEEIRDLDGKIIDGWQEKSEDFFKSVLKLIDEIV